MIEYELDYWQIKFLFQLSGSVVPKAFFYAAPSTALAVFLHVYAFNRDTDMTMSQFGSYSFVLGFLVVFRAQQAYNRFWEAGTILQRVRGTWFNAISACCSFCSYDPADAEKVFKFKHALVRLGSLLYCAALQQVSLCEDEAFEVIDISGFSEQHLAYLGASDDPALVVLQWLQQLIVKGHNSGVLKVPPPILSRVFQELSNGIVGVVDAQKITEIFFPFPLAQLVGMMLLVTSVLQPVLLAIVMDSAVWCGLLNFITIFAFFGINSIAAEIEMPFGDDPNDLPLHQFQEALNTALVSLMDTEMVHCPEFELTQRAHELRRYPCPTELMASGGHHHKIFKTTTRTSKKEKANRKVLLRQTRREQNAMGRVGTEVSAGNMAVSHTASTIRPSRLSSDGSEVENAEPKDPVKASANQFSTIHLPGVVDPIGSTSKTHFAPPPSQSASVAPADSPPFMDRVPSELSAQEKRLENPRQPLSVEDIPACKQPVSANEVGQTQGQMSQSPSTDIETHSGSGQLGVDRKSVV